jgi:hypothetical protein
MITVMDIMATIIIIITTIIQTQTPLPTAHTGGRSHPILQKQDLPILPGTHQPEGILQLQTREITVMEIAQLSEVTAPASPRALTTGTGAATAAAMAQGAALATAIQGIPYPAAVILKLINQGAAVFHLQTRI